jgi:hypothetical protein
MGSIYVLKPKCERQDCENYRAQMGTVYGLRPKCRACETGHARTTKSSDGQYLCTETQMQAHPDFDER